MREIEFRGKDKTGIMYKDWFYGSLDLTTNPEFPTILCKDKFDNVMHIQVDKETIGQYIGLNDNCKQKVFEGDIMQDPFDPDEVFVVDFIDGEFVLLNDVNVIVDIEQVHFLNIIGNIHDNKEFYKSEDN